MISAVVFLALLASVRGAPIESVPIIVPEVIPVVPVVEPSAANIAAVESEIKEPVARATEVLVELEGTVKSYLPPAGQPAVEQPAVVPAVPAVPTLYSGSIDESIVIPAAGVQDQSIEGANEVLDPRQGVSVVGGPSGENSVTQQSLTAMIAQLNDLETNVRDVIARYRRRNQYAHAAVMTPIATYLNRISTDMTRLQNRLSTLSSVAQENTRPAIVDASAVDNIRRRIGAVGDRIGEVVQRVQVNLGGSTTPRPAIVVKAEPVVPQILPAASGVVPVAVPAVQAQPIPVVVPAQAPVPVVPVAVVEPVAPIQSSAPVVQELPVEVPAVPVQAAPVPIQQDAAIVAPVIVADEPIASPVVVKRVARQVPQPAPQILTRQFVQRPVQGLDVAERRHQLGTNQIGSSKPQKV